MEVDILLYVAVVWYKNYKKVYLNCTVEYLELRVPKLQLPFRRVSLA